MTRGAQRDARWLARRIQMYRKLQMYRMQITVDEMGLSRQRCGRKGRRIEDLFAV